MISRLLREPLLHFLLLGGAIFVLFGIVRQNDTAPADRIVVSGADLERLSSLFAQRWQRPPTATELRGLVDAHVREEILYREALALGLDRDDAIVRRRMAQKVEFLFEDLAGASEPDASALQSFLAHNADRFTEPARIRFRQVYFNSDRRGAAARTDAEELLARLRQGIALASPEELGDRLMLEPYHDANEDQIARLFGREFASRVVELPVGEWNGPIDSGYGVHLVYVEDRTSPRLPALAEIDAAVREEYLTQQRRDANEAFYRKLRDRYDIVVEDAPAATARPPASAAR